MGSAGRLRELCKQNSALCIVSALATCCTGYYLLRLKPPFYQMNGIDAVRSAALEHQRPSLSRY